MNNQMDEISSLDAKCILIAGGTTPIGRATAALLAEKGAIVFLSGEDKPSLDGHLASIRKDIPGCSVTGTPANLAVPDDIGLFFLNARIALPKVDVLINCPCLCGNEANQTAYSECAERAFQLMKNRTERHIINIAATDS